MARPVANLAVLCLCALPHAACAQYVDTTAHTPMHWHVGAYSLAIQARELPWHGDSLRYDATTPEQPSMGGEVTVHRGPSWSFGISVGVSRSYLDAMHRRTFTSTGDGTWNAYGEHMGLAHRFVMAGVQAMYEPWPYPRRRKVGMSVLFGAGLHYLHLHEKRFLIRNGMHEGTSGAYISDPVYDYPEHGNMEVLGESRGSGIGLQLNVRGELHFGRRFSMFVDYGMQESTSMQADGSTFVTPEGTALTINPHTVDPAMPIARAGFIFHWWGWPL